MENKSALNSVLVPTDFSRTSSDAFGWALRSLDGDESVIIVLHVMDQVMIEAMAALEIAPREEITNRMRERAEQQMAQYKNTSQAQVAIDTIVVEGIPFLEIIQKADDFAVDAIVMGQVGIREHVERLLFGSTVDKVVRGTRRPVIVLPETV